MYSQVGEKLRTDTFGRNNAHPVSRECEGALCFVTHAPERRRNEDHWPGKFPQSNALFYCNLNSKQEVRFHQVFIAPWKLFNSAGILRIPNKIITILYYVWSEVICKRLFFMLLRNALSGSRCAFFPRKVFDFGGKTALPRKHTEASL